MTNSAPDREQGDGRAAVLGVPWHRSVVFRAVALSTAIAALCLGVCVTVSHRQASRTTVDTLGLTLRSMAASAAPFLAGVDLDAIRTDDDAGGDAFLRVRAALARIREGNGLNEDQAYILRPDGATPGLYRFVAMLQAKTFIGDPYTPPPEVEARYQEALRERVAVRTPLFTDDHGSFISGIAPVLRADGTVAGLLQVDYGVSAYLERVSAEARELAGLGALVLTVLLAFGVFEYVALRRQVLALLAGTTAIQQERYAYQIPVRTADEIGRLARGLNASLEKLRERFEMLKFLPPHTARMIRQALEVGHGVALDHAERVRVAVLETDIRGFTKISERLSPEQVIAMLNQYIRAQAQIITGYGGSIDKFMGDAVLAVFEGDNLEDRALRAAVDIQVRIAQMNRDPARPLPFPVNVGAGLSVGEVVMGNMGSETRMEHTVIGSVVNLAARLCSAAGAGEVVVTAELVAALGQPPQVTGAMDFVECKGFAQPVACMRLTPGDVRSISSSSGDG